MSKAMMKALLPLMAATAMMGVNDSPYTEHRVSKTSEPFVSRGMPVPRVKTEDEIKRKKDHRNKLKARRNAKKGIHVNKIKYKRKRS